MRLTKTEVVNYINDLINYSSHVYIANDLECKGFSYQTGRSASKIVNLACEIPHKNRCILNIVQVTFEDGYIESILSYNDILKVKYAYNIIADNTSFETLDLDDEDWQVDLQRMYSSECR